MKPFLKVCEFKLNFQGKKKLPSKKHYSKLPLVYLNIGWTLCNHSTKKQFCWKQTHSEYLSHTQCAFVAWITRSSLHLDYNSKSLLQWISFEKKKRIQRSTYFSYKVNAGFTGGDPNPGISWRYAEHAAPWIIASKHSFSDVWISLGKLRALQPLTKRVYIPKWFY